MTHAGEAWCYASKLGTTPRLGCVMPKVAARMSRAGIWESSWKSQNSGPQRTRRRAIPHPVLRQTTPPAVVPAPTATEAF